VGGNGDSAAKLAVDLDGQFHRILDELGGIELRPRVTRQALGVAQSLPDFLRYVGRERGEHQGETQRQLARDGFEFGHFVV